jgi:hypothetical protein
MRDPELIISPSIIANSDTLVSHMLNNADDVEMASGFFMSKASTADSLRKLAVGEAMVKVNHPRPLSLVRCKVATWERETP